MSLSKRRFKSIKVKNEISNAEILDIFEP